MAISNRPLRVNLQVLYRWSRFRNERCERCKQPAGYGAKVEFYMPIVKWGNFKTKAEKYRAADDYCNILAYQQEQGNFTMYAMYILCGDCASREIVEDFGDLAIPVISIGRLEQRKNYWIAVLLQYEPGPYGRSQPLMIYSQKLATLEKIYAYARQGYLSDRPHLETYLDPTDEA